MIFFSSNYLTSLNYNNPFPSVLCKALEHNLVETQCHLFFQRIQLQWEMKGITLLRMEVVNITHHGFFSVRTILQDMLRHKEKTKCLKANTACLTLSNH